MPRKTKPTEPDPRQAVLDEWLDKHNARCAWDRKLPNGTIIAAWQIGIRHSLALLAECESATPTVMLDELEPDAEVGYYDLRRLCLEQTGVLSDAGLVFDDEHRVLHRVERPPRFA